MIPVSRGLNEALKKNYHKGNFSLWFNKFIELEEKEKDFAKPRGKEKAKEYILKRYNALVLNNNTISNMLMRIHQAQEAAAKNYGAKYLPLVFRARLISRLITGLGQTHPTETGMVLDHNLGIPYIPASSIKGLVRAGRRLNLGLSDEKKDNDSSTLIPAMFGGQNEMGKVIFLDAYPEDVPDLELDIMTPHYSDYYKEKDPEWPGDWMTPTPIKFLTVSAGTVFIFRALIDKAVNLKSEGTLFKEVESAFVTTLTVEGVGAKTSVGYGRFKILEETGSPISDQSTENSAGETTKSNDSGFVFYASSDGTKKYYLERIEKAEAESDKIEWLFQKWENDSNFKTDKEIASAFLPKIKKTKKTGKETHFYKLIKSIIGS